MYSDPGFGWVLLFLLFLLFLLLVAISRWIFRINHIVDRLDSIINALEIGFNVDGGRDVGDVDINIKSVEEIKKKRGTFFSRLQEEIHRK